MQETKLSSSGVVETNNFIFSSKSIKLKKQYKETISSESSS
jgi:hypothetical protein